MIVSVMLFGIYWLFNVQPNPSNVYPLTPISPSDVHPLIPIGSSCPPCQPCPPPDHCKKTGTFNTSYMKWENSGDVQPVYLGSLSGYKFTPEDVNSNVSVVFGASNIPLLNELNQQSPFDGKIISVNKDGTISVNLPRIYAYLPSTNAATNMNATGFIY